MSRWSEASFSEHGEAPDEAPGRAAPTNPRFAVGPELGRGGMGRVMRLDDELLGRSVACKEAGGSSGARLLDEGRILARLQHPGIVPIHDAGVRDDGTAYLVLSHIDGVTLSERLRQRPDPDTGLRWVLAIARALGYAHSQGVVHRDLKPDNIMVSQSGEAVVVDWGLAREIAAPPADSPAFSGTPGYASPEQVAGTMTDPRADVFSLGVILVEVLAGRSPFTGLTRDTILARLRDPSPLSLPPLPPEVLAISRRALAHVPTDRYANAGELADDLLRYLEGRRVRAYAYSPGELARRFVSVFRWPLVAGVGALTVAGALLFTGLLREERLREEVERELGRALAGDARGLAAMGQNPDAKALAARAHELAPDAETMGLLLATSLPVAPRALGRDTWPACDGYDLAPNGSALLCRRVDEVALYAGDGSSRTLVIAIDNLAASFVERGELFAVHTASQDIAFYTRDGQEVGREPLPVDGLLTRQPGRHAALAIAVDSAVRVGVKRPDGSRLQRFVGCTPSDLIIAAASAADGTLAVLCRGGGLRVFPPGAGAVAGSAVPMSVARSASLRADVRNEPVSAAIGGRDLWVGTTRGDVWRVDLEALEVRSVLPQVMAGHVRLLEPGGESDGILLVGGDRPGLRLIDAHTGARLGAMPLAGGREATFTRVGITTFGVYAWQFEVGPRGVVGHFDAPGGVTSLALDGDVIAIGHGREATLLRLDGERLERRSWPRSITKSVAWRAGPKGSSAARSPGSHPTGVFAVANRDADGVEVSGARPWLVPSIARRVLVTNNGVLVATYSGGLELWRDDGTNASLTDERVVDLDGRLERFAALGEGTRTLYTIDLRGGAPMVTALSREQDAVAVAWSPDEEVYAAGRTGVVVHSMDGPLFRHAADAPLIEVAVSPEGDLLAAGSQDGRVFLWRVREREPIAVLRDHDERVPALVFGHTTKGTRLLVSGSWDETVRVRDLTPLVGP